MLIPCINCKIPTFQCFASWETCLPWKIFPLLRVRITVFLSWRVFRNWKSSWCKTKLASPKWVNGSQTVAIASYEPRFFYNKMDVLIRIREIAKTFHKHECMLHRLRMWCWGYIIHIESAIFDRQRDLVRNSLHHLLIEKEDRVAAINEEKRKFETRTSARWLVNRAATGPGMFCSASKRGPINSKLIVQAAKASNGKQRRANSSITSQNVMVNSMNMTRQVPIQLWPKAVSGVRRIASVEWEGEGEGELSLGIN